MQVLHESALGMQRVGGTYIGIESVSPKRVIQTRRQGVPRQMRVRFDVQAASAKTCRQYSYRLSIGKNRWLH